MCRAACRVVQITQRLHHLSSKSTCRIALVRLVRIPHVHELCIMFFVQATTFTAAAAAAAAADAVGATRQLPGQQESSPT